MANADIKYLNFSALINSTTGAPSLYFDISFSENFSDALSLQLLYWKVNEQQTWITIKKDQASGSFIKTIELPIFAVSGKYAIRAISIFENTGINVSLNEYQLAELQLNAVANLENPNADNASPYIKSINALDYYFDDLGFIHIPIKVSAADDGSGLSSRYIIELLSPSGASLQQWATFDESGNSTVDFVLDKSIASGEYKINTVRISDLAGNNPWLHIQSNAINLVNPNSDSTPPLLSNFSIEAVFDENTNRPIIVLNGLVEEPQSGLTGVYVRLRSPTGSTIDAAWLNYSKLKDGTYSFSGKKALSTEFTPGEYLVDYVFLQDKAGNKKYYNNAAYPSLVEKSINIYFPKDVTQIEVSGSGSDDYVFGSNLASDILIGGDGGDYLYASDGNDTVDAGGGNDTLIGGSGSGDDSYVGGAGIDTIIYTSAKAGITIDLSLKNEQAQSILPNDAAGIGVDQLTDIENIISGNYNDLIVGDINENHISGNSGDDTIIGGAGNDTLEGGAGNDSIYGDHGDDLLSGGDGSDLVYGGEGNDTLVADGNNDVLIGDIGIDICEFNGKKSDYKIEFKIISIYSGYSFGYSVNSLENSISQSWLLGVEKVRFSDGEYFLSEIAPPDTTEPKILTFSPADKSSNVSITDDIVIFFDENIRRGDGDISLKTFGGEVVEIYDTASSSITINGKSLAINPINDLKYNTIYKIEFGFNSIVDVAGNQYTDTDLYNFATNYYPFGTSTSIAAREDTAVTGTLAGTDLDGNTLTFTKVGDPSHGTVSINASTGAYTYTPAGNYNGSDSFTFKVNDGTLDSAVATMSITVKQTSYDISVKANSWRGSPLSGVKFSETGNNLTDSTGTLYVANVEDNYGVQDGQMVLTPNLPPPSSASSASVTLTDVLAALKIYLGKSLPDSYSSPFNYIAADFDGNGSVNLTDVLSLLKFYLGKNATAVPAWVFVNASNVIGSGKSASILRDGSDTIGIDINHTLPHSTLQDFTKVSGIEFIGVLRGDIDGSWGI